MSSQHNNTTTTTTTVTIPREKYEELIKEFQKLQSQNTFLKKAVVDEQKKNKALQSELERKSSELEGRKEENDVLGFNNLRLEKRCAQLMFDLEEKSKSATRSDSIFSSFWSSSGSQSSLSSVEATQLKKDLEVIQEELKNKIQENEQLHIQIFEVRQGHDVSLAQLKDTITDLQSNIHQKDKKLEETTLKLEGMIKQQKMEKDKLQEYIQKLKSEIKLKKESEEDMTLSAQKLNLEVTQLTEFVNRKVPFDDTSNKVFNLLNIPPFNKRYLMKRMEHFERSFSVYKQLSKALTSLYASIIQKIQLLSKSISSSHSPTIKYINNKITTSFDIDQSNSKFNEEFLRATDHIITDGKNQLRTFTNENGSDHQPVEERAQNMERKHYSKWYKSLKSWLQFHRDSLLYLVVSMQENECSLDSPNSEFIKYQDIYMRTTELTQTYQKLHDSMTSLIKCLDDEHKVKFKPHITTQRVLPPVITLLQKTHDDMIEFVQKISEAIIQEQKVVFVSPTVKSANEKIIKSLSVTMTLLSNLVRSYKLFQQLQESNSKVYSRGALCDYSQKSEGSDMGDQVYYGDNNTALSLMQSKAQKFMGLSATIKQSGDISLSTAMKNRRELDQLRQELQVMREKVEQHESQLQTQQSSIQSMRDEISAYERRFMECFVKWNMILQRRNLFDLPVFDSANDTDICESANSVVHYIEKVEQMLEKCLDIFEEKIRNSTKLYREEEEVDMEGNEEDSRVSVGGDNLEGTVEEGGSHDEEDPTSELATETSDAETSFGSPRLLNVESTTTTATATSTTTTTEIETEPDHSQQYQPAIISQSETCTVQSRLPTQQELNLFSQAEVNRERQLKEMYENQIDYLMKQIDICDLKAVEYRLQWQHAVIELEEACERESRLNMQLEETQHMLDHTKDEFKTHTVNYENQIQILSDNLAVLQHRMCMEDDTPVTPSSGLLSFFSRHQQ